jgi:hypothetical protein
MHTRSSKRATRLTLIGATGVALTAASVAILAGGGTAASAAAPSNSAPPTISGSAQEGSSLTATQGTWSGSPTSYAYSWRRCDKDGGSCAAIDNATDKSYTLKSVDVGNTLRVRVTATNADGSNQATSVPTAVVAAAPAPPPTTVNGCPAKPGSTVQVSDVTSPANLVIDATQVEPSTITRGTRTVTARFHVTACNASIQGALVYVTAVPYGQFSIPNEQPTGADGWATLTFQAQAFPVSARQQLLVMFVRARKAGENILAGISARRLVSFRVA